VQPVGEDTEVEIDVRVIAATNRDMTQLIASGAFRMDLYQRLNVVPVYVPPLRERQEDILPLMTYFIRKHAHYYRGCINSIDPRVIDAICALQCEGNVRQLENLVRHVLLTKEEGDRIELADLPRGIISRLLTGPDHHVIDEVASYLFDRVRRDGMSLAQVIDHAEKLLVSKVLAHSGHNQTHAARLLQTTPRTIFNKLRKHNL
jgi:transcriptional regulator with PAS, ATPase and Fis domain